MGIVQRTPILVCDVCGLETEMTNSSNRYGIWELKAAEFYTSGSIGSYEMLHNKKAVICSDCLAKISKESETFRKLWV